MLALYHNEISSSSQKVRLCLAEKALAWDSRLVILRTGEHQAESYRKLNPRAVVPTLVDDDDVIQESTVINEYLEEKYPAPALMPVTPIGRARVRLWSKQVDESIHDGCIAVLAFGVAFREPLLANRDAALAQIEKVPDVIKRERRKDVLLSGLDSVHVRIAILRFVQLFDEMEEALAAAPWLAGPAYTLADLSIVPYLSRLEDLNLQGMYEPHPSVKSWFERCKQRPSYRDAIEKWDNPNAIQSMKAAGARHWPTVSEILKRHAAR